MPQLVFADFAPQLVWLAITFTLLYLILARVALPRIATTLEKRRDVIANDLDEAGSLKRQAEEALKAYEAALAAARGRALAIVAETRQQLTAQADNEKAAMQASLAKRTAEAEARITAAKTAAMANVRQIASDTAAAIVGKLLGDTPDGAAANSAVDAALKR
ncbi:MAG: F-type H+-transporting ATPase subunit b [Alphaproteobacteria bacterium]|nr:F-type H+-transporting ATPase subunit b [Alphaproteobacteria bacterium]